jgi:tRNA pseudouridine38-40 synthase
MRTARLTIEYDGRRYSGWAAQAGSLTVQGELEAGLQQIARQPIALTAAGRTDAGVHASGQVASFTHEAPLPEPFAERVNAVLPRDIAVLRAEAAPDGFDARRDARSRSYRYRVLVSTIRRPLEEGRALWWRFPLDRAALDACAEAVVGKHDFTAFTPTQTEHVLFERDVISCSWAQEGRELLALEITAPSFMRNQVRILTGTMLEVGGGRRSLEDFCALLDGAVRRQAGETAPAHGLCLVGVSY